MGYRASEFDVLFTVFYICKRLHVVIFTENQTCHSQSCPSPPVFHFEVLLLGIFQDFFNPFAKKVVDILKFKDRG